jgi:hypothetical protein
VPARFPRLAIEELTSGRAVGDRAAKVAPSVWPHDLHLLLGG